MQIVDTFIHRFLQRPYRLAKTNDLGEGQPVVFLHGIASSSKVWEPLLQIRDQSLRFITFDLLGFGASPKPQWPSYTVEQHARAVIASLKKARLKQPVVLVGHSMGCLIAAHIAYQNPGIVKRLI